MEAGSEADPFGTGATTNGGRTAAGGQPENWTAGELGGRGRTGKKKREEKDLGLLHPVQVLKPL